MAAMVIVGCMASVIYIVRKRELYEKLPINQQV